MNIGRVLQGGLFTSDFLIDAVQEMDEWQRWDDGEVLETELQNIFNAFPIDQKPNESQTEDDLIWPILNCLGWKAYLRQQNLTPQGRDDVPDGLLFEDDAHKARANDFAEEWRRYEWGLAIVESKRWDLPLDRRSAQHTTAPSTQMLRYLRRVDDLTEGKLRWGILTNGAQWRLYYQGARSVSEQFFEIDLAAVLGPDGGAFSEDERRHCLKLFALFFGRDAFLPGAEDPRTFHERVLDEGRFYQERVANSLSGVVFSRAFPNLARAIAAVAPDAPLPEVRDAALVLLYRLLFILYAEDRNLLPVRDDRYDDYGLRQVRDDIGIVRHEMMCSPRPLHAIIRLLMTFAAPLMREIPPLVCHRITAACLTGKVHPFWPRFGWAIRWWPMWLTRFPLRVDGISITAT